MADWHEITGPAVWYDIINPKHFKGKVSNTSTFNYCTCYFYELILTERLLMDFTQQDHLK